MNETTMAETLNWNGSALNPRVAVWRLRDGSLMQVGNTQRVRASNPKWGWRDIVSVTYYSADGMTMLRCEASTPTKINAMRASLVYEP